MSNLFSDEPQDVVVPEKRANGPRTPVELRIDGLAGGGRGVGRSGGKVWFVEGALPGDRLLAEPRRVRKSFVEAVAVERLERSADLRQAPCPQQDRCGGCPWMPMPEPVQIGWKRRLVEDALRRIGRLGELSVEEVVPSPRPLGYRGKVEFQIAVDAEGRRSVGFRGGAERELVDIPRCLLQHEEANRVLESAREHLLGPVMRQERDPWSSREPWRLIIRRSHSTGEILMAVRGAGRPSARWKRFAESLIRKHEQVAGIAFIIGREGRRGGAETLRLAGRPWIEEELGGTVYRLTAGVFFQVNPEAAARLVDTVAEFAGPVEGMRILDLYGGVGSHAFPLAAAGAQVTVCEADAGAIRCGRKAAEGARGGAPRFVRGDVLRFLRRGGAGPDLIVANPPRTGLGRGVARGLAGAAPAGIVMVSCDPATLARDLSELGKAGYRVLRIRSLDLFPQTSHVETVVLLER